MNSICLNPKTVRLKEVLQVENPLNMRVGGASTVHDGQIYQENGFFRLVQTQPLLPNQSRSLSDCTLLESVVVCPRGALLGVILGMESIQLPGISA